MYPLYPQYPHPSNMSYWQLRQLVRTLPAPRTLAEWHYQQAVWEAYRRKRRRRLLLWLWWSTM